MTMKDVFADYLVLLFWACLIVVALCVFAPAQTPPPDVVTIQPETICLYHPEYLMNQDPAQRPILIQARLYGWPQNVPAIPYIRQEWRSGNPDRQKEAISAAIQYSIYISPGHVPFSQRVRLTDYVAKAPNVTLYEAVRQYVWLGDMRWRNEYAYWLSQAIEARSNMACNPWRNYDGGGR
jgi:hypothetical protein